MDEVIGKDRELERFEHLYGWAHDFRRRIIAIDNDDFPGCHYGAPYWRVNRKTSSRDRRASPSADGFGVNLRR